MSIEAQIYVVFPLMLLFSRGFNSKAMAASVLVIACLAHLSGVLYDPLARIDRLLPQFYAGFAFGVMAADKVSSSMVRDLRSLPFTWIAAALGAALVALFGTMGFVKVNANYFTVDLVVSFITAVAFIGFAETRSPVTLFLGSRPLQFLGQFSYSLYLIHGVIVGLLITYWLGPAFQNPLASYVVTASVISAVTLVASFFFFSCSSARFSPFVHGPRS